jgi:hypothetical protein
MAALLQLQRRLGRDNFPLIEQHFFPSPTELVSEKSRFSLNIFHLFILRSSILSLQKFSRPQKQIERLFCETLTDYCQSSSLASMNLYYKIQKKITNDNV